MKMETILQEAQRLTTGDRQESYGHPLDDFTKTAGLWSVILGVPVTAEKVALCMVAVKISRELNAPKRDNLVDGAGYFNCLQMVREERVRRAPNPPKPAAVGPGDMPCDHVWETLESGRAVCFECDIEKSL